MSERREAGVDPAVLSILGDGERRSRLRTKSPGERRKARRDEERSKATYDIPDWLQGRVADLAAEERCSISSVVCFLLVRALEAYERGEIDFEGYYRAVRHLRFDFVLETPFIDAYNEENHD